MIRINRLVPFPVINNAKHKQLAWGCKKGHCKQSRINRTSLKFITFNMTGKNKDWYQVVAKYIGILP